jgi:hypothetical protein
MRSAPGPIAHFNNRDAILIPEIVRRGVTDADLDKLMLPIGEQDDTLWRRVQSVMEAVIQTGQLGTHRQAIERLTFQLGGRDGNRTALQAVFFALRDQTKDDYTDLALECLSKCTYEGPPLAYLDERAATEEVFRKIQSAVVPDRLRASRAELLKKVRERIQENQKR